MRVPRVFLAAELESGRTTTVSDNRLHYLTNVLRLAPGAELRVFNGEGGEYEATITDSSKRHLEIQIGTFQAVDRESALRITLAQGLAKGEKMDWIVQKATELGVARVQPLFTRYSDVKLNDERAEKRRNHWQEIAISACEQCGRDRVPTVDLPQPLDVWIASLAPQASDELRLVLNPQPPFAPLPPSATQSIVLVGPEGGFREDEITQASMAGFHNWSLGPRVLRAETAAVAAVALAQSRWGDLEGIPA